MMSHMLINAVLYRLRQLEANIATIIVSGLVSNVIMMPVTLAFVVLFKKSAKKHDYLVRYQLDDSEQEVEIQVDAYGNPVEFTKYDLLRMDLQAVFNTLEQAHFQCCHRRLQQDGMNSMIASLSQSFFLILHNREVNEPATRVSSIKHLEKIHITKSQSLQALTQLLEMWDDVNLLSTLEKREPTHLSPDSVAKLKYEVHVAMELLEGQQGLKHEPSELDCVMKLLEYCDKFHACSESYASDSTAVLRHAQKEIKRAKEELVATKKMLKKQLRASLTGEPQQKQSIRSVARRSLASLGAITSSSKRAVLKTVNEQVKVMVHETKHHVTRAQMMRKEAQRHVKLQQKDRQQKAKAEIDEVVQTLKGVEKFKKRFMLQREAKRAKMLESMPLHERQVFLKEQEKLKDLRLASRLLYNQFIRKKPQKVSKPLFPDWVNYVIYVICTAIDGFAAWFVLQFSFTVGGDVANAFIGSILVGILTTWVVSQPISIFVKMGIMPVIATSLLINTGIFQTLSTETFALGAAAAVGMAGVVRRREKKAQNVPALLPDDSSRTPPLALTKSPRISSLKQANEEDSTMERQIDATITRENDKTIRQQAETISKKDLNYEDNKQETFDEVHPTKALHCSPLSLPDGKEGDGGSNSQTRSGKTLSSPSAIASPRQVPQHSATTSLSEVPKSIATASTSEIPKPAALQSPRVSQKSARAISPQETPMPTTVVSPSEVSRPAAIASPRTASKATAVEEYTLKIPAILGPSSLLTTGSPNEDVQIRAEPIRRHDIFVCECGQTVPNSEKDKHVAMDCSHRLVQCRAGCGIFIQARARNGHEMSQCRLVMCTCGKMILKHKLRKHQESECKLQSAGVCRFGCGESLSPAALESHERDLCALRPVECPKCNAWYAAQEIETHVCRPTRVKGPSMSLVDPVNPQVSPKRRMLTPLGDQMQSIKTIEKSSVASESSRMRPPLRLQGPRIIPSNPRSDDIPTVASTIQAASGEGQVMRTRARMAMQEEAKATASAAAFNDTEGALFSLNDSTQPLTSTSKPAAPSSKPRKSNPYKVKSRVYIAKEDADDNSDTS
ncbi:hypothetical protein LEN26_011296 [Aphanomyces euteiches]|nr:hypothetical protein LEN26_011296 [Aphanomyces euteiches]